MKKILLFVAMATLSLTSFGQTVWDFTTLYPLSSGTTTTASQGVKDNLGFFANPTATTPVTTFVIDYSSKTFAAAGTFAGGALTSRFKLGGKGSDASSANPYKPSQTYVYFNVTGPCTINVFNRSSSSTPTDGRILYITDGTNLLASYTPPTSSGDVANVLTANYTGGAGVIYIYGYINAFNIYRIEASANVGTTTEILTALPNVTANKPIKSVEYYDALGKKLPQTAKGLVVKKITYEDGTSASEKAYIKEK